MLTTSVPITLRVSGLKATKRMAYADCFGAALAKVKKAQVVTGNKECKQGQGEIKPQLVGASVWG